MSDSDQVEPFYVLAEGEKKHKASKLKKNRLLTIGAVLIGVVLVALIIGVSARTINVSARVTKTSDGLPVIAENGVDADLTGVKVTATTPAPTKSPTKAPTTKAPTIAPTARPTTPRPSKAPTTARPTTSSPTTATGSIDTPVVYSTKSLGTRTFYFVRVEVPGGLNHTFSLDQWRNAHFRTDGTSFKTVLEGCSFGKLKVEYAGGIDIMLDKTLAQMRAGYDRPSLWLAEAIKKANQVLGKDVYSMANHVVICSPRNASWWSAIGPQDGNRIHMHDVNCMSLSVLVHEFGHNMNLLHSSWNGNTYGDYSCFMGASWKPSDGPKKCFNGYKNWQLKWYEDKQVEIKDFTSPTRINLAAFADYPKATASQPVLVKVLDYFIQYNRAKGINSGIELGDKTFGDQVTVVENTPSFSVFRQGLFVGQSFKTTWNQQTLYVSACNWVNETATTPEYIQLAIGYGKNWC